MKKKFFSPDLSDKRIYYASKYLEKIGYIQVENCQNADFVLLGVNPDKKYLSYDIPIYSGNVSADNVFDYTKSEEFAAQNAYVTAESALAAAITMSEKSLINSSVLLTGYGRISKALHKYLSVFTSNITVCARNHLQRSAAHLNNAETIDFEELKSNGNYDFIFNTVPHPVFNEKELSQISSKTLLIDLASFPGGVEKHIAKSKNINLITARGLPAKYSPQTAGKIVAQTVNTMITEGKR